MRVKGVAFLGLALALQLSVQVAAAARPWRIVLPDTVHVQGGTALLRDVALGPVPAAAGDLVLTAGVAPNTAVAISRQTILRKLVTAGLSAGVSFRGADRCYVAFAGRELRGDELAGEIRRQLQALVPTPTVGGPAPWFELSYPQMRLSADGDWGVTLSRHTPLEPGRNLVQVRVTSGDHTKAFAASVVLHSYGETARAIREIGRDTPLSAAQFNWEWQDLANVPRGVIVGRTSLAGTSTARKVAGGAALREADLHETPVIQAGDSVDLLVIRGQVAVTVRAVARQKGCLDQTIPVRNELTGRLVNARVAGPGLVEWRR